MQQEHNRGNIWVPFKGMQTQVLESTAFETLAGGARGPGKTDAGVVWLAKPYLLNHARARSLVIRKNGDDLADWLDRARYYYARYGGVVTGKPAIIRFPKGYVIRTGHLKDENAYTKYQGQEYQRMLIEELTQIPRELDYLKLLASCRSTIPGLDARVLATTNPGGIGHVWVKRRFVDPAPWGQKFMGSDTGRTRIFIPGKVDDNPALVENDPSYLRFLDGLKDTDIELWKAWRNGDWDTFAGQFFREFMRMRHVIRPFNPKKEFTRVAGLDWGRTDPFSVHYGIVTTVKYSGLDKTNPQDRKIRDYTFTRVFFYQEVYGTDKSPAEWGKIMNEHEDIGNVEWIECDNMIFNPQNDTSASIADQFYAYDPRFRGKLQAQSSHLLSENKNQRVNRAEYFHKWLSIAPDGFPYCIFTETCQNAIRTIPELVHDENNVEDVDQQSEDHAYDSITYCLKRIKWIDAKLGGVNQRDIINSGHAPLKADKPIGLDAWSPK